MRSERPEKLSAAALDGVMTAISPALIIGMIGSLVFFLVIAFYRGQYDWRLMFILGCFTVAIVLIARIAIENGRVYATAFSLPLAVVAMLAMMRFVTINGMLAPIGWIINAGLLACTWFLADKITFDCTLLEEKRESIDEGLLQTLGVTERAATASSWQRQPTQAELQTAKHNPGVWVLYFALLAFPLFGLGQLVIPDTVSRQRAFWLLVSYLGFALALLANTSLLAMRRYLRQRQVVMPPQITAAWLGAGAAIVFIILLLCMLLPLPGRNMGLVGLPFDIGSTDKLLPSNWGWGNDGQSNSSAATNSPNSTAADSKQTADANASGESKSGESKSGESKSGESKSGESKSGESKSGESKSGESKSGESKSGESKSGESKSGESKSGESKSGESKSGESKSGESKSGESKSGESKADSGESEQQQDARAADQAQQQADSSNTGNSTQLPDFEQLMSMLAQWFRWLTIAVLAAIVLFYVVKHPNDLAHWWRGVWNWLSSLVFGTRRGVSAAAVEADSAKPELSHQPLRFSAFQNPFASDLRGWQPQQVIQHTFAALEAWGAERGVMRGNDQTAEEYAKQLNAAVPQLAGSPLIAANMLDRMMFADWKPNLQEVAPLAKLWRSLSAVPAVQQSASAVVP